MKQVFHTVIMLVMFSGLVFAIAISTHSALAKLERSVAQAPQRETPRPLQAGGGFGPAIPANR